ncbi:Uncharacterised protein [Actinomadura madurae]|nr:Uncharacterised protein [Actinomadura madurae]
MVWPSRLGALYVARTFPLASGGCRWRPNAMAWLSVYGLCRVGRPAHPQRLPMVVVWCPAGAAGCRADPPDWDRVGEVAGVAGAAADGMGRAALGGCALTAVGPPSWRTPRPVRRLRGPWAAVDRELALPTSATVSACLGNVHRRAPPTPGRRPDRERRAQHPVARFGERDADIRAEGEPWRSTDGVSDDDRCHSWPSTVRYPATFTRSCLSGQVALRDDRGLTLCVPDQRRDREAAVRQFDVPSTVDMRPPAHVGRALAGCGPWPRSACIAGLRG